MGKMADVARGRSKGDFRGSSSTGGDGSGSTGAPRNISVAGNPPSPVRPRTKGNGQAQVTNTPAPLGKLARQGE